MSLFTRLIPTVLSNMRSSVFSAPTHITTEVAPGGLFSMSIRNVIRCHFPRPSERKRIKRHGWKKRMSTEAGRRILMRRILKGRYVLSH